MELAGLNVKGKLFQLKVASVVNLDPPGHLEAVVPIQELLGRLLAVGDQRGGVHLHLDLFHVVVKHSSNDGVVVNDVPQGEPQVGCQPPWDVLDALVVVLVVLQVGEQQPRVTPGEPQLDGQADKHLDCVDGVKVDDLYRRVDRVSVGRQFGPGRDRVVIVVIPDDHAPLLVRPVAAVFDAVAAPVDVDALAVVAGKLLVVPADGQRHVDALHLVVAAGHVVNCPLPPAGNGQQLISVERKFHPCLRLFACQRVVNFPSVVFKGHLGVLVALKIKQTPRILHGVIHPVKVGLGA